MIPELSSEERGAGGGDHFSQRQSQPCGKRKQSLSKTLQETQCDRSAESKGQWGQDDGGGDVPGPVLQDLATDGKYMAWEDITVNKTLESPFTS